MSISTALFQLFCTYGVGKVLISDNGSGFTAKVTQEVCKMLQIPQQFTPSFMHSCLGACERIHGVLAERLTPYIEQGKNWVDMLPAIVFSINSSVNSSTGFTPFEIIFGQRPRFPLAHQLEGPDFRSLPPDTHTYVKAQAKKLTRIREEVRENSMKAQSKMLERANAHVNPLPVKVGDYVYLSVEPTGQGQKLKFRFDGPFVVTDIPIPHMVKLRDPVTGHNLKQSFHINRLKMAYVRDPNPIRYFNDRVITNINQTNQQVPEQQESAARTP